MNKRTPNIESRINDLPTGPGVYQFFDAQGKLIYIGKAKNLKKRVQSYFQKTHHESFKVKVLVEKIRDIGHIVVSNESDALLLENNLIKEHQPRYNVLLKDDKTFPWICIRNEPFPRVFLTRKMVRDGSEYFGPYTSAMMARTLLDLIREIYQLRTCKYQLSSKNIEAGKFTVCLEYHIENCRGPCEGLQTEEEYMESIDQIRQILKGNLHEVMDFLKKQMQQYAGEFRFEEAERMKQKIALLDRYQSKSTIVSSSINNVDVYSIAEKEKYAVVNYLNVSKGAVVQAHTVEIQKKLDETAEEILRFVITDLRERVKSAARELILPMELHEPLPWYSVTVPKRGDKKKLLDLSTRNARAMQLQIERRAAESARSTPGIRILTTLQKDLRMKEMPKHIECFDNSNIQGASPAAACVVFKDARPLKREYRHYHIRSVKGPDDYASMREVVYRRYKRLTEEHRDLPQLVIIDGGKGQLSAAVKSLTELGLQDRIAIIGIAKKLEEIYFPNDPVPLYIDKNSESLKLIQQLRNEAHRFGISLHRNTRSGTMTRSELTGIDGIGQKTMELLFREYKSVDRMRKASREELAKLIGSKRAENLVAYFSGKEQSG